jgi:hypothetical protein
MQSLLFVPCDSNKQSIREKTSSDHRTRRITNAVLDANVTWVEGEKGIRTYIDPSPHDRVGSGSCPAPLESPPAAVSSTASIAAMTGEPSSTTTDCDQGLIPVKLLAFDQAVNLTLGLPFIRTSPDHGTAFDIVGRNRANPGSMRAAIELAIDLAVRRQRRLEQVAGPSGERR